MRELVIHKSDAGQKLDRYILKRFKTMPEALMRKYLRKKCVKVNGKHATGKEMLCGSEMSMPLQSVPLYSIEATAGLVPLFEQQSAHNPINYIHIPNLPKCDGAVYVVGDSMYPLLKSGDIVLYKQLHDLEDIFWGDMYLLSLDIDGEEYVTIKYIQRSDREGYVRLVSQNQHHAEKEVQMKRIRAIALVKASIRMNSMR